VALIVMMELNIGFWLAHACAHQALQILRFPAAMGMGCHKCAFGEERSLMILHAAQVHHTCAILRLA